MSEQKTLDLLSMSREKIYEMVKKMILKHTGTDLDGEFGFYAAADYFIIDSKTILVKYATLIRRISEHFTYMDKLEFTIKAKLEGEELVPVEVS